MRPPLSQMVFCQWQMSPRSLQTGHDQRMFAVPGSKPARILPGQALRLGRRRQETGISRDTADGLVVRAVTIEPRWFAIRLEP